jgi:hypothetical protein
MIFLILKFREQGVFQQNHSTDLTLALFHDRVVLFPRGHFSDCYDIVICGTKSAHDRKIAALVGEKAHRLSVGSGFWRRHDQSFLVSQGIGCVAYGRLRESVGFNAARWKFALNS